MSIINLAKWTPGAAPIYAWRYPETNLSTYSQLIVAESQEAVLFSKGRMMGKFGPGKHTLNTENLPILRELFGIPFGGQNPFTAEVWFVNKLMPLNIEWATDAMPIMDAEYRTMVPLRAKGRYGLRIVDPERFLVKLVGTIREYTAAMLTDNFRGIMVAKTKSVLAQTMQSQGIGVRSIAASLDALSGVLQQSMRVFWEDYGFELIAFYVTSIDVDDQSPIGQRILQAMADQSAQSIAGHTWQQQKAFDVAEKALTGGKDVGIMGALLMTGGLMGGGGGAMGAEMMRPQASSASPTPPAQVGGSPQAAPARQVFCSNCSTKFSSTSRFCPHCGDPYSPCPKCGADNDIENTRCVTCGTRLQSPAGSPATEHVCSNCGMALDPKASFCSACGRKAV
jgi:membrane protease subunit (stomatin/prohibitin family)